MKQYNKFVTVFFGYLGIHRYMAGEIGMGILYTCTCGLFFIGWFVDIYRAFLGDRSGRRAKPEEPAGGNMLIESASQACDAKTAGDALSLKPKSERHHVAGTSFRQQGIKSLGYPNDAYKLTKKELIEKDMENERIYQFLFDPYRVELIEEPDDSEFPHAVKVIIDNIHVGYIKKGSAAHVKNLIHKNMIEKITADISGGKYKYLYSEYDEDKDEDVYMLETNETEMGFYVTIELFLRDEAEADAEKQ